MKGLILKDLFAAGRNLKSLAFIFALYALVFIPSSGAEGYVVMSALLCSMMIATTFTYDDQCKWTRYAVTMPVSRREIVAAKYLVLAIFVTLGCLVGVTVGAIGNLILKNESGSMLLTLPVAWGLAYLHGAISIVLTLKFGTERARMVLVGALTILAAVGGAIYGLFRLMQLPESAMIAILCCLPIPAAAIGYGLFCLSTRIFSKQAL